jgi:copper transport protein
MTRMLGALLALFVLCSPTMAVAHAILLRTAPLDGAVLQQSPDKLAFQFNETVVPVSVRLVDATGRTLAGPDGAVSINGEVALTLPAGLPPGRYVASYRVASADTHPIAGAIQFAVGEIGTEPLSVPIQEIAASNWSLASIGVRFVRDVALSLGVGGIFFSLAIARQKILTRFFSAALGVAAIASLAGVGIAGARLTQASTLFDASVWLVGAKFSAANAAILILAGLAISARALQRAHAGLAAAGLGLVAWGTAATGHAATGGAVAVLAQTLHSFCAFLWLGAFLPLHAFAAHKALAPLQQAARRFSDIGLAMLAGLALGALYLAATRVTLETAFESDYARMLGAKAALIGALLVIAAQNRWRLVPLLASHATARARLRRNLRLDMALGVALVALTAVLSHTPPMGHDGAHHHPPNNGKTLALMREGHQLTLQVVGTTLDLYLATPTLQPFEPLELQLELASSERSVEALRIATARIAPGHYRAQVPLLAGGGSWQLRLDTLVTDFKKIVFETTLDVP